MKLFQSKCFWQKKVSNESFNKNSLVCCQADAENDIIIVGSLQGIIRIFSPHRDPSRDALLEYDSGAPILQLLVGNYADKSGAINLAVLQPKKLIVFMINGSKSQDYSIFESFRHNFEESNYNMTNLALGHGTNLLAVQHMTGSVRIIREKHIIATCSFKQCLLPGPLAYMENSECFVTVSSSMEVECYRYSNIIMEEDIRPATIYTEWEVNIGQGARDIRVRKNSAKEEKVFVLGDYTLYILDDKGTLLHMNKLQNEFISFLPYFLGDDPAVLMGALQACVYGFRGNEVFWSCKVDFPVIQLERGTFENNRGIMVALGEEGSLECFYFGTDPAVISANKLTKHISQEEARREIRHHLAQINTTRESTVELPRISFNFCDKTTFEGEEFATVEGILTTRSKLTNVQILLKPCREIRAVKSIRVPLVDGEHKFTAELTLSENLPSSLRVEVFVCFEVDQDKLQLCSHFYIPLSLVAGESACQSKESVRFRMTANNAPGILAENDRIGFKFNDGSVSTIFRVDNIVTFGCENYGQLWLMLESLRDQLDGFGDSLPLDALGEFVDEHHQIQTALRSERASMEKYANQLYSVEKSFLSKLKNPTSSSLASFEFVCDKLLDKLNQSALVIGDLRTALSRANTSLAAFLKVLITFYHHNKSSRQFGPDLLMNIFCADSVDENWEENVRNNLFHILSKNSTNASFLPDNDRITSIKPLLTLIKKFLN